MAFRRSGNRGSFVSRGKGPGRLTEWFGTTLPTIFDTLPGATFIVAGTMSVPELAKRPFTVTRTVGSLFVLSDQVAALERPFGALGFIVVSSKAVATGATAIPDPVTEASSDEWFQFLPWAVTGGPVDGRRVQEFKFDSRAQRKVADGEEFVAVIANGALAAIGAEFLLNTRILVKLS